LRGFMEDHDIGAPVMMLLRDCDTFVLNKEG
jgi:hypothetical protein